MKEEFRQIHRLIESDREEMMALWEELVNTDSGSRNIDGLEEMCRIVRERMESIGFATRVILSGDAGPVLIGELGADIDKEPILFIGHMDTVFKDGEAERNPFRVDEDGKAYGPGVLDMKAGLVIALYAAKALKSVGYKDRPIKCIFAGDEENLHMFSSAKSIMAEEAKGAVAAFNFETGYLDDGLVVGRKGGGIIELVVHGVAAHSGIAPEKGCNANLEMAHKIVEIESKNDLERGKLVNCGTVTGGASTNTISDICKVEMAIRFPSVAIRDELISDIHAAASNIHVPGTSAEVNVKTVMEAMEATDGVMELYKHVEKVAKESGYGDVHPFEVGGVSDSGITVTNGIPTVCALGVKGEANHTPNEYAVVDSLFERAALAAGIVLEYK